MMGGRKRSGNGYAGGKSETYLRTSRRWYWPSKSSPVEDPLHNLLAQIAGRKRVVDDAPQTERGAKGAYIDQKPEMDDGRLN